MREVKILAWCDLCPPEERKPSEVSWTVAMNEGDALRENARTVDLCPEHVEELETLSALFIARGVPSGTRLEPGREERSDERIACPVCGSMSAHRSALGRHLRVQHDARLSEFPSLAITKTSDKRTTPIPCPECGKVMGGAQGLGAHRRAAHGVIGANSHPNGPGRPGRPPLEQPELTS